MNKQDKKRKKRERLKNKSTRVLSDVTVVKNEHRRKEWFRFDSEPDSERTIKNYAKKFYQIMRDTPSEKYVNCLYLQERFKEAGWDLNDDPFKLWRIWRQAESDFPNSVEFIPQRFPGPKGPVGWKYIGPPQYERKRRKRLK